MPKTIVDWAENLEHRSGAGPNVGVRMLDITLSLDHSEWYVGRCKTTSVSDDGISVLVE
jgi:hypothetical protein